MIVVADEAASTTVVAGEAGSAIIVADEAAIDVADDAASAIDVAGDAASAAGAAEHSEPVRFTWTGVSWRPSALRSERSAHASVTAGMRADTDGVESARCMTTDSSWPLLSEPAACEQALTVEVAGPVRAASERTAPERGAQVAAADPPARWTLVGVGALQDPSPDEAAEPLSGAAVDAALQARRFSRSSTLPIPPISVGTSGARARMRSRWAVRSRQLLVPLTAAGVLAVVYATVRWPADSSRDYRDEAVIATPLAAEPPSSAAGRPTQALPEPVVIPAPAVIEPPVQAPEAREPAPAIEARQRRKREDAPEANAPAPLPTWPDPEPLAIKPAAHDLQLSLGPAYDGPQAAKLAPPKAVAAAKLGAPSAAQPVSTASLPRAAKIEQLTLRGPVVATRVRRALERIRSQLTLCYEAYAPTDAGQRPSPVRVELVLNELGRVRTTDVQGASSLALGECVASASKKLQLGTPDTGRVSVSWTTTYGPVLPAAAITLKPEIDRGF